MTKAEEKQVCPSCGGTGQLNFFQGESRFVFSYEECTECAGLGYLLDSPRGDNDTRDNYEDD